MEPSPKPADTTSAAPKKRGKGLWIGITAVVLIAIIGIAAYYYMMPPAANISIVDDGKCTRTGDTACAFSPTSYTATGRTVTWKNNGAVDHTEHFFADLPAMRPYNSTTLGPDAAVA